MSDDLGNKIQEMFKNIYDAADLKYLRPLKVCISFSRASESAEATCRPSDLFTHLPSKLTIESFNLSAKCSNVATTA